MNINLIRNIYSNLNKIYYEHEMDGKLNIISIHYLMLDFRYTPLLSLSHHNSISAHSDNSASPWRDLGDYVSL